MSRTCNPTSCCPTSRCPQSFWRWSTLRSRLSPVNHLCVQSKGLLRHVLRALLGAICGAVVFLGIAHNLALTLELKLMAGAIVAGVCAVGGACSSHVRCSLLLMFPLLLGSRGRAYIFLLLLTQLYSGPLKNLQENVQACALSLSCNMDLQVNNSRILLKHVMEPFMTIALELNATDLGGESLDVRKTFQTFQKEVMEQHGAKAKDTNDTNMQQQLTTDTKLRCDSVVNEGVSRCADWFALKWSECMAKIAVPLLNMLLCLPMKFDFLCDILRVTTPWCEERIPLEGNTGQLWDQLNQSMAQFKQEFKASVVLEEKEDQEILAGPVFNQAFTDAVQDSLLSLRSGSEVLMEVLQTAKSFTFITIIFQAVAYLLHYRRDLHFDNAYITPYFRRIEMRRKTQGKRCVLPLSKADQSKIIQPCSLRIHPQEASPLFSGLFQSVSVGLLTLALVSLDLVLVHVLEIVSRNTVTQFNLTGLHKVHLKVDGNSTMARLLKKTISAFNNSAQFDINSSNRACSVVPSSLSVSVYVYCAACVLMVALWSLLYIYSSRLRRAICAFYFPQREKSRVLFLYNLLLQSNRKRCSSDGKCCGLGRKCCGLGSKCCGSDSKCCGSGSKCCGSDKKWNNVCALVCCCRPENLRN